MAENKRVDFWFQFLEIFLKHGKFLNVEELIAWREKTTPASWWAFFFRSVQRLIIWGGCSFWKSPRRNKAGVRARSRVLAWIPLKWRFPIIIRCGVEAAACDFTALDFPSGPCCSCDPRSLTSLAGLLFTARSPAELHSPFPFGAPTCCESGVFCGIRSLVHSRRVAWSSDLRVTGDKLRAVPMISDLQRRTDYSNDRDLNLNILVRINNNNNNNNVFYIALNPIWGIAQSTSQYNIK